VRTEPVLIVSSSIIYAMFVNPAILRLFNVAFDDNVPSRIRTPLLPLAVKVILVKVGFDVRDMAIGSPLQF